MMKKKRKKRFIKVVFALNAFVFIMGAMTFLTSGKLAFGIIQLIAGLGNLGMLLPALNEAQKAKLNLFILAINVIVAITVVIDYIQSGTQYIQYMWMLTALLSLGVFFINLRKQLRLAN